MEDNYKVVLLGGAGVGKTTIVNHYDYGKLSSFPELPTIGAAFCKKQIKGKKFYIWDTAGQEKYRALCQMYCRGASCIIGVYDLTSKSSLETLCELVNDNYPIFEDQPAIILVGNKKDLGDTISELDLKDKIDRYFPLAKRIKVSALDYNDVKKVFEKVYNEITNMEEIRKQENVDNNKTNKVEITVNKKGKGKSCC